MKLSELTDADLGRRVRLTHGGDVREGIVTRVTRSSGGGPQRIHIRRGYSKNGFVSNTAPPITRQVYALRVRMTVGPFPEALVLYEHGVYGVDVEFLD